MTDWQLIDDGSWNGLRKWIRGTDEDEGSVQVRYEGIGEQQIIEDNKRADTHKIDKDMWHVGHIPASVGMKWLIEDGTDIWSSDPDMRARVKRKLMDSDYRHLVPGMARIFF